MQHFWRVTSAPGTPQTHDRLGVRMTAHPETSSLFSTLCYMRPLRRESTAFVPPTTTTLFGQGHQERINIRILDILVAINRQRYQFTIIRSGLTKPGQTFVPRFEMNSHLNGRTPRPGSLEYPSR